MNDTVNYKNIFGKAIDDLIETIDELTKDLDNKSEIELKKAVTGFVLSRYGSDMGTGFRPHQLYALSESEMLFVMKNYLEILRGRVN